MTVLLALSIVQSDPYMLDIGRGGSVTVDAGLTSTITGRSASMEDVVKAAEGLQFVVVGESHDQLAHHQLQADVIQALVDAGRDVVVGFEMFTRDNQENMAPWSMGYWTDEEFQEKANWKTQWGFDYAIYKPIFDVVKGEKLPIRALNVPRDWIRQVGRNGPSILTPEQREWAPDIDTGYEPHRRLFTSMMGGHPMTGAQGENVYSAQVTWDEGMATSALDYMNTRVSDNLVMVIIAGSGHMMYDTGINYRIWKKTGQESLNITCITSAEAREVSRGISEFVFVSRPTEGE